MATRKPILLSWSSGKDSAWALHELQQHRGYDVVGLVTTVNQAFDRVAMHAVRHELLREQAAALGLPLRSVALPWPCSNDEYETIMRAELAQAASDGVEAMAFGDLFLEDVREYRVRLLAGSGVEPIFPLWGRDTKALAYEMVDSGLRAHVVCVDPKHIEPRCAGNVFDRAFLDALPANVDPCGERGEFHTFVSGGPMFSRNIEIRVGEVVERDGFVFADVVRAGFNASSNPL